MTIGAYILLQNPKTNNYPYLEVISCCLDLFDEILIVDGGTDDGSIEEIDKRYEYLGDKTKIPHEDKVKIKQRLWPDDASWDFLTQQYDFGLQNLTTDWRIKMDADYIFHQDDLGAIRQFLEANQDKKIVSFEKRSFNLIDRYRMKTKIGLAVNKKAFPNIHWNTDDKYQSGDEVLEEETWTPSGIKVWVYDNCFKNKENIKKVMYKFARAASKKYGINWGYESEEAALKFLVNLVRTRQESHNQSIIPLEDHPKYIQEKIKNMTDKQLGYSLFGYRKASYFE